MFVILGAAGNVGRITCQGLRARGHKVRAVMHKDTNDSELLALGCELVTADIDDPESLTLHLSGAEGVQLIRPVNRMAADVHVSAERTIDSLARALRQARPDRALVISDYGAHLSEGTGMPQIYHRLETRLEEVGVPLTCLRSAEHMQNWTGLIRAAVTSGILPVMHSPLSQPFATISAPDLGAIAAELLSDPRRQAGIVHAEGPRRYSPSDLATMLSDASGTTIEPREVPKGNWLPILQNAGMSESHARLIVQTFEAHHAKHIDVEPGAQDIRRGETEFRDVCVDLIR